MEGGGGGEKILRAAASARIIHGRRRNTGGALRSLALDNKDHHGNHSHAHTHTHTHTHTNHSSNNDKYDHNKLDCNYNHGPLQIPGSRTNPQRQQHGRRPSRFQLEAGICRNVMREEGGEAGLGEAVTTDHHHHHHWSHEGVIVAHAEPSRDRPQGPRCGRVPALEPHGCRTTGVGKLRRPEPSASDGHKRMVPVSGRGRAARRSDGNGNGNGSAAAARGADQKPPRLLPGPGGADYIPRSLFFFALPQLLLLRRSSSSSFFYGSRRFHFGRKSSSSSSSSSASSSPARRRHSSAMIHPSVPSPPSSESDDTAFKSMHQKNKEADSNADNNNDGDGKPPNPIHRAFSSFLKQLTSFHHNHHHHHHHPNYKEQEQQQQQKKKKKKKSINAYQNLASDNPAHTAATPAANSNLIHRFRQQGFRTAATASSSSSSNSYHKKWTP